ncbi:MAG: LON peptidase substrate-binding domain-containing protein, partial [Deltaproteobacteria bacterium]|nr:LON peptidase substrate-binding domain-containing protein [Deltaproteobacteria bacterium]
MDIENTITNLLEIDDQEPIEIPEELPLMPVRDVIVFPSMIIPLFIGREASVAAINEALTSDRMIFLVTQKDASEENPSKDGLYKTGVVAMIMRTLQLPDGRLKVLGQALVKGTIQEFLQDKPCFRVRIETVKEEEPAEISVEVEA